MEAAVKPKLAKPVHQGKNQKLLDLRLLFSSLICLQEYVMRVQRGPAPDDSYWEVNGLLGGEKGQLDSPSLVGLMNLNYSTNLHH